MITVTEESVVSPVCCRCTDSYHRNIVDDEHDRCEDRKTQDPVGYDPVDLIGCCKYTLVLLNIRSLYNARDKDISLIRDDGLGIVIELCFRCLDILLDMRDLISGKS